MNDDALIGHLVRLGEITSRLERLVPIFARDLTTTKALSGTEAAGVLGMNRNKFNRLVRLKLIRPIPGKKKQRRYDPQELLAFRHHKKTARSL